MPEKKYGYGYYFRCIDSILDKNMNEQLKKFDMTKSQQDVLHFLHRNKMKDIKQKDIEDFFHISNPTVTGILNRLEQKGYIERIPCESDKRIKLIRETEKAESLHHSIFNQIKQSEHNMVASLSEEESQQLFILLDKVYQNLLMEEKHA